MDASSIEKYKDLMASAKAFFRRLRDGDDGADALRDAYALESRLDKADKDALLDKTFNEIKTAILQEPEKNRTAAAKRIWEELRDAGATYGSAFAANGTNLRRWLNRLYNTKRNEEMIRYVVRDIWEWVHCFAQDTTSWWCAPRRYGSKEGALSKHYRPELWPDLGKYLNVDGHGAKLGAKTEKILRRVRFYDISKRGIRSADEWQAIAFIIYNSIYFNADLNFTQWSKVFCDALNLPPFTARPFHSETWTDIYNALVVGDFKYLKQK